MIKSKQEDNRAIELASKLGEQANANQISDMEVKLPAMKKGPIVKIWDKVVDIYNGFMSDQTPSSIKVLLIGSLLYLVLPIDVIPDFIPGAGLLDDVTVLTYVWTKFTNIAKLGTKIGSTVVNETIGDKLQISITNGYNKAFEFGKNKLEAILKKKAKLTIRNSVLILLAFIVAILFLSNGSRESSMIASLIIWILFVRTLVVFIGNIPLIFKFLKIYFKEHSVDKTISVYIKSIYPFITPIESFKKKIKFFKAIPDVDELVSLQRKALNKTIITLILTIIISIGLAFVFRRVLIFYTDYNFIEIIILPFRSLIGVFK
jgi:uncharacterized membrane protein YkvA (DUF1232 family)